MFNLQWTPEAAAHYSALRQRAVASLASRRKNAKAKPSPDEGLFKQTHKCVTLLAANPRHPGLHTHHFHGLDHPFDSHGKVFEAYVQNKTPGAYRAFWCYGPGKKEITILAITAHP